MKYFTKQWYRNNQKPILRTPEMKELEKQINQLLAKGNPWSEESIKLQYAYDELLCNENEHAAEMRKVPKDYWEHHKQIKQYLPDAIKDIIMHDCFIMGSGFVGKDFYMNIDSSNEMCDVSKLTFVNAEFLESDVNSKLQDVWWIYDEVYLHQDRKDRYEMHILFYVQDKDNALSNDLAEMIIIFDDIIIDGNWVVED